MRQRPRSRRFGERVEQALGCITAALRMCLCTRVLIIALSFPNRSVPGLPLLKTVIAGSRAKMAVRGGHCLPVAAIGSCPTWPPEPPVAPAISEWFRPCVAHVGFVSLLRRVALHLIQ